MYTYSEYINTRAFVFHINLEMTGIVLETK